jgi:RHS repeat-associated protein
MGTHFFWDPVEDNIIQERDDTGAVTADYTTEPYLYGDLISQRRDGESRFYCFDGQGSTLALTDAGGNVTDTNAYTAFGEVTEHNGSTVNPFQYVGQKEYLWNPSTAECRIRQRPYLPSHSRWLCFDPVLSAMQLNRFLYVYNSPLVQVDPSGLDSCFCGAKVTYDPNIEYTLRAGLPPDIQINPNLPIPELSTDKYTDTNTVLCTACQNVSIQFDCLKCENKLRRITFRKIGPQKAKLCIWGIVSLKNVKLPVKDLGFSITPPRLPIKIDVTVVSELDLNAAGETNVGTATDECQQAAALGHLTSRQVESIDSKTAYPKALTSKGKLPSSGTCDYASKWPDKL